MSNEMYALVAFFVLVKLADEYRCWKLNRSVKAMSDTIVELCQQIDDEDDGDEWKRR